MPHWAVSLRCKAFKSAPPIFGWSNNLKMSWITTGPDFTQVIYVHFRGNDPYE